MDNLATASYVVEPSGEAPIGQWDDKINLLNYPTEDKYPFDCELYEKEPEHPSESDESAIDPIKSM